MKTYFKSFENYAAYAAYENTEDLFIAYIEDTGDMYYVNDNPATVPYTITSLEDGANVNTSSCFWSTDGENWFRYDVTPPVLNTGDSIMFKTYTNGELTHPSIDKQYAIGGNIMSLMFNESYYGSYLPYNANGFYQFYLCDTSIVNAQNLILPPPNYREDGCFNSMFNGCSSLTHAPRTLSSGKCYDRSYISMFEGCYSLTHAPILPATELAKQCYTFMFERCTSLTTAPALPATIIPEGAYESMFEKCTSLTATPDLSHVKFIDGNGTLGMFRYSGISSITDLNLSQTRQATIYMFCDCNNLTDLSSYTINIDTTHGEGRDWFSNDQNLTHTPRMVFTQKNAANGWITFNGCASLIDASGIIIDTSNGNEFDDPWGEGMFSGCSSLDHFEIYGPEWPNLHPDMFTDVASSGTFTVPAVTNYDPNDYIGNGIPSGWTIVRASA